uniref:Uncharacterized protein n=1 Tax=Rhizophora mucronata TaxID=61149 RepID=A0A2P2PMP6_RHIMU
MQNMANPRSTYIRSKNATS